MGSVQQLIGDLTTLSLESKRRFPEIRQACDHAIGQLKHYDQTIPIHDIKINDDSLIKPFIGACKSGTAKLITLSIPVIHKLVMAEIIPPESLSDLVNGLQEASHLAIDIQLRILQCLPALMQNYHEFFTGPLLIKLLTVCSNLTANNKSTVVINTASATLQQLFSNIFDLTPLDKVQESEKVHSLTIDNDEIIKVDGDSLECFNIFQDLCKLIEGETPTYFTNAIHIKVLSVLEIIENIISNHKSTFQSHQELAYLLRIKIIPSLLRILNSSHRNFPYVTRTMRVLHVLLASQLDNLEIESEIVLSFLNHILVNNDTESLPWEKILVLETYKGLFGDFNFIKSIFVKYDNNPRKKNVLQELTSILNTFLSSNSYLFSNVVKRPSIINQPSSTSTSSLTSTSNSNNSVTPLSPSKHPEQTPVYLSKSTSNLKAPLIDHFDKSEPPSQLPKTYPVYLVFNILLSYADGVAAFVQSLSNDSDPANLESDVEFTNAFIESNYNDISILFERFIYSAMDDESFHLLIRSFQRFAHSTGLLGLGTIRDGLLIILSNAITNNVSKDDNKVLSTSGSGLQSQGKQLLAFGESLVESFSSTLGSPKPQQHQPRNQPPIIRSRYINSRHITILRALANLAVSLGSTLQGSWTIIWITFQWCDYFVNGPDEYSGYYNHKGYKSFTESMWPHLTPQDLNNIEISRKKLMDNFREYPVESFDELVGAVIDLSKRVFEQSATNGDKSVSGDEEDEEEEQQFDEKKPIAAPTNGHSHSEKEKDTEKEKVYSGLQLDICPYNKTYFIDRLLDLSQIESNKFLVLSDKSWSLITDYFITFGNKRNISYSLRLYIVQAYNQIIKSISDEGFRVDSEEVNQKTSFKSLDGLNRYLVELFNLGIPQELLVLNCETEIHLSTLTILHQLIDQYDSYYKDSWNTVFTILNTPFKVTEKSFSKEEVNLRERIRLLIEKSFDTLKLILDEFLTSIPSNQLILLIDTLYNFCSQSFDLNISFSSVSYFWLISDSLKSRVIDSQELKVVDYAVLNEQELITKINNTDDDHIFHILIIVYLLSKLVKLSLDPRAQVRDGSIQTFFQIVETHGNLLTTSKSWDLIYTIVLPTLFNIKLSLEDPTFSRKEWIESLHLILTGFNLIYNNFMINFNDVPLILEKWEILINYFQNLLDFKWVDLNLKVFKSFQDLLTPFTNDKVADFIKIRDLLFKFWVNVPIEYDFINPLYQESVTSLMTCFPPLYPIIISKPVSNEEITIILNLLNKCARYPILPNNQGDESRPSNLQKAVLNNLSIIDLKDSSIQSQVIQQLSNIIVYPFGTRLRIEQKLTNNKVINGSKIKLPTFIAISHLSLQLLKEKLQSLSEFTVLLEDKGVNKILKSLLEVVKTRSIGVANSKTPLWIECNEIVESIIKKLIDSKKIIDEELWKLLVESIKISFKDDPNGTSKDELINIEQFHKLIKIILPTLVESPENNSILNDLIQAIYDNSFLYEFDEQESLIISHNKDGKRNEIIDAISLFDFNETFGTTKPVSKFANRATRFNCLKELVKFSNSDLTLRLTSQSFFILRAGFSIRRFISDQRLLYKCPISKIQQEELLIILRGIVDIKNIEQDNKVDFQKLQRLVIKLVTFAHRIPELDEILEIILQRF